MSVNEDKFRIWNVLKEGVTFIITSTVFQNVSRKTKLCTSSSEASEALFELYDDLLRLS